MKTQSTTATDCRCKTCGAAEARIEGAERALLERDVAEVQRAIDEPDDSRALTSWKDHDCREWLARAKAVLG